MVRYAAPCTCLISFGNFLRWLRTSTLFLFVSCSAENFLPFTGPGDKGVVVPLQQSLLYIQDWLGLRVGWIEIAALRAFQRATESRQASVLAPIGALLRLLPNNPPLPILTRFWTAPAACCAMRAIAHTRHILLNPASMRLTCTRLPFSKSLGPWWRAFGLICERARFCPSEGCQCG